MMTEWMGQFLNEIMKKTDHSELIWQSLRSYRQINSLIEELPEAHGFYIDMYTNSVKVSDSYYLQKDEGALFLLYIWHSSERLDGEYYMFARVNDNTDLQYLDFGEGYHRVISQNLQSLANTIHDQLHDHNGSHEQLLQFLHSIVD